KSECSARRPFVLTCDADGATPKNRDDNAGRTLMKKPDEGRRAFLVGTAAGAGAAASVALVPEALAKTRQHQHQAAADAPAAMDHMATHAMSGGHGAFFNDDDTR